MFHRLSRPGGPVAVSGEAVMSLINGEGGTGGGDRTATLTAEPPWLSSRCWWKTGLQGTLAPPQPPGLWLVWGPLSWEIEPPAHPARGGPVLHGPFPAVLEA